MTKTKKYTVKPPMFQMEMNTNKIKRMLLLL